MLALIVFFAFFQCLYFINNLGFDLCYLIVELSLLFIGEFDWFKISHFNRNWNITIKLLQKRIYRLIIPLNQLRFPISINTPALLPLDLWLVNYQRYFKMKQNSKQLLCSYHQEPIIKVELCSRRLICSKCLSETESERRYRIELLRVKLNKNFENQLKDLREIKGKTDKIVEVFLSKNMVEAKRLINKSLPDIQKRIDLVLQTELNEANTILKKFIDLEMEKWTNIDGRQFHQDYFLFQQHHAKIQLKISETKKELKAKIAAALKNQVRIFYSTLFDF